MINTIIRLRRDNDFNYKKIENTFIPANGEICLIDTARDGLRAVCGDGTTVFSQLKFIGELIFQGYFYNQKFYEDQSTTILLPERTTAVYIDLNSYSIYCFNGNSFEKLNNIPNASEVVAGIVKLYPSTGSNTDGTMTQKAITDELNKKFKISLSSEDDEMIIFTV